MEEERWKDVVGYEQYFMISDHGRVWSKRSNKILKQVVSKTGYCTFATKFGGKNGKAKGFRVHRLVAEAFVDNPYNKPFVNHLDCDKTNNHYSNLEWCTRLENSRHASEMGLYKPLIGEENKDSKLKQSDITFIRENYKPRCNRYGARALAKKFNVVHSRISEIVNYKSYTNV